MFQLGGMAFCGRKVRNFLSREIATWEEEGNAEEMRHATSRFPRQTMYMCEI